MNDVTFLQSTCAALDEMNMSARKRCITFLCDRYKDLSHPLVTFETHPIPNRATPVPERHKTVSVVAGMVDHEQEAEPALGSLSALVCRVLGDGQPMRRAELIAAVLVLRPTVARTSIETTVANMEQKGVIISPYHGIYQLSPKYIPRVPEGGAT